MQTIPNKKYFRISWLMLAMGCSAHAEQVTILMPDGSPATKAKVEFRFLKRDQNNEQERVETQIIKVNEKGEVDLPVETTGSSYHEKLVVIDAPGAALAVYNFFRQPATIRLAPAYDVTGVMVTKEGVPLVDGEVSVTDLGTHCYLRFLSSLIANGIPGFHAKTDKEGRFKLQGATFNDFDFDPGARLKAEAMAEGKRFTVSSGASYRGDSAKLKSSGGVTKPEEPIRLVAYPVGRVSGTIINGHSGKPCAGAEVRLQRPYTGYDGNAIVKVGEDGDFSFEDVPSYEPRVFEVTWATCTHVHPTTFGSPTKVAQETDVSGLRVITYDEMLCKGTVVDEVTGKPPIILLDLGYVQESDAGQGWTTKRTGDWGNIGMDARVHEDGSFQMWLPSGPFSFTAEASRSFGKKPYQHEQAMNLDPADNSPLLIKVPRRKGVFVANHLKNDPDRNSKVWEELIISVGPAEKNWFSYASDGPMWFFPVENWGDKINVTVEHRPSSGGERVTLVPKTTIAVSQDMWPYTLEIPLKQNP